MNTFPISAEQLAARLRPTLEKCATPGCRLPDGSIDPHFEIGWLQGDLADALNLLAAGGPLDSEPLERTRQVLLERFGAPETSTAEGEA